MKLDHVQYARIATDRIAELKKLLSEIGCAGGSGTAYIVGENKSVYSCNRFGGQRRAHSRGAEPESEKLMGLMEQGDAEVVTAIKKAISNYEKLLLNYLASIGVELP